MATAGVLLVALLPAMAAVTPEAATAPEVPVALTQPIGRIAQVFVPPSISPVPESAMIMLVGSGLMGLGMIVRRSTRE